MTAEVYASPLAISNEVSNAFHRLAHITIIAMEVANDYPVLVKHMASFDRMVS